MNKFEQLIEFVINDEQDKAKELFHDIVVEKSRDIYENIMAEEEALDETVEEVVEAEEIEEAEAEETVEESIEEELGGSETLDLIDDIETEEEGISMEAEGEDSDEGEEDEDLEDRVVDVENKLDELMAEFEELMNDVDTDGDGDHDMDDHEAEEAEAEEEVEMMDMDMETESLEEGADLTAAPKPVTSEESGTNTDSANNDNAGAKGAEAKPAMSSGEEKGRAAPSAQDMGGTTSPDQKPAPKPVTK